LHRVIWHGVEFTIVVLVNQVRDLEILFRRYGSIGSELKDRARLELMQVCESRMCPVVFDFAQGRTHHEQSVLLQIEMARDRLLLGSEYELTRSDHVEERLDADPVAHQADFSTLPVVPCECEHAMDQR
jgi:hypothetical protein